MELRLLTDGRDREAFVERMTQARATHNGGFRETADSCIAKIHMQFGRMYALYDDESAHPEQMAAGFIMHSLSSFAQSYPQPDFSRYTPDSVFEIGEMWSLARRGGNNAQRGAVILLGLLQAKAVVGYAIVKPWDLTMFYKDLVPTGDPIDWPYARTIEGGKIYCRAMVSEGDHLRNWVYRVWETGFETRDGHSRVRFPAEIVERRREQPAVVNGYAQESENGNLSA
jgi:hypothetical protein